MSYGAIPDAKRIAVASKRKCVADFFALEAESCGCSAYIMPIFPIDPSEYDVIIADHDVEIPELCDMPEGVYRLCAEDIECNEKNTIIWPIPVSEVRKIFQGHVNQRNYREICSVEHIMYLSDDIKRTVMYKNQEILLSVGEWKLLKYLSDNSGEFVQRSALQTLFGSDGSSNLVDVYVCHLRRKLEAPFNIKIIETKKGKGYKLTVKTKKYYI